MYSYLAALGSRDLRKGEDRSKRAINNCSETAVDHTRLHFQNTSFAAHNSLSLLAIKMDMRTEYTHVRKDFGAITKINLGISHSQPQSQVIHKPVCLCTSDTWTCTQHRCLCHLFLREALCPVLTYTSWWVR